jgi:hypothetical protein
MNARWLGTGLAVAVLLAGVAGAQEKGAEKGTKAAAAPDQKAMLEAMQKAATPGEAHKKLEAVVGTFDVKVTMWMDPGKPPAESTGTAENKWALGNRYVEERFEGTFMGQPFSGIGYTGYDNVKKKYVSTWMDTASTGIMLTTGSGDASGKTMNMSGTMDDPMTGKPQDFTEKMTVADNDHHMLEMWGAGPDGKNYKMMEIQYTRKK